MSLRKILAEEGLIRQGALRGEEFPETFNMLTEGDGTVRYQDGWKFITDNGRHFRSGKGKFVAWLLSPKTEESLLNAKANGKTYVPMMKIFPTQKEALAYLNGDL